MQTTSHDAKRSVAESPERDAHPRRYRGQRISVVIPCFNEEHGLAAVLAKVPTEVDEVLVLDNCSSDATVAVALAAGERVRVVCHPENLGYGGSYIRGLTLATGDVIITTDGDGTYPIGNCLSLVDALIDGNYDFLSGTRFPLQDAHCMSRRNRTGNRLLNAAIAILFGVRLLDGQSGMWVLRKDALDELDLRSTGMEFSNEIKIEAFTSPGLRAGEVNIPYAERIGDSKLFPFRDGARMVKFLLRRRLFGPGASGARVANIGPSPKILAGALRGDVFNEPSTTTYHPLADIKESNR